MTPGSRSRLLPALWLAYLLFFVYGSLVPLQWRAMPLSDAWALFIALPGPAWPAAERVDAAVNFLLPVPLAFGLAHAVAALRGAAWRALAALLCWPLLAALSVAIEFAQVFAAGRDPSWSDVAAQWGGAAAGLLLYLGWGARFRALLAGLHADRAPAGRARVMLALYLLGLLVFALMPLDLSLSPVELYRKWRDGRVVLMPIVPLLGGGIDGLQFAYELLSDIVLWVPVGLLWRLEGHRDAEVLRRGLVAAALLEAAQLLVLSRVSDVNDVLLAGAGVWLGARLARAPGVLAQWPAARQARALALAGLAWLAVAVVLMWAPFAFDASRVDADALRAVLTRTPFSTYFARGELAALGEILRKVLVLLPAGLLASAWAWAWRRGRPLPRGLGPGVLVLLALLLEAGQLFEPTKLADLTDAALGAAGALLGWRIGASLLQVQPLADGRRAAEPAAASRPPRAPLAGNGAAPGPSPARLRLWQAATVLLLAAACFAAARLPGVPYNVPKLIPPGAAGVLAALGVAAAAWWLLAAPLALLAPQRRSWRLAWLPLALAQGLLLFALLRMAVPLQMIHKVIGTPVLGGPAALEDAGRFVALHLSLQLPLWGGALLAWTVWRPAAVNDFIQWLVTAAALAWPLHMVVVEHAATDNLVELMRHGGSLQASMALAGGTWLLAAAGSALALAAVQPLRRGRLLVLALIGLAAGPALLGWGLEPVLVKYDRVFSALQFIVSASRDRYAVGVELAARAAFAAALALAVQGLLQAPAWRALTAPAGPGHGPSGGKPMRAL